MSSSSRIVINKQTKNCVHKYYLSAVCASFFIFVSSLIGAKYYTDGDQVYYRLAYEGLANLSLLDGYFFYYSQLSSLEITHFLLTWLMSGIGVEKDLVMATANSLLVYYLMKLFERWKVSLFVAIVICTTNYYLLGLYFSTERLKIGFLFFIISVYYASDKKKSIFLSAVAIISHIQTAILYVAILFPSFAKNFLFGTIKLFKTFKLKLKGIGIPLIWFGIGLTLMIMFFGEHVANKFYFYTDVVNENNNSLGLLRVLILLVLTLIYTTKYTDVLLQFTPLILAVFFVGGDRVNALGYVIFMSYALKYKRGLNFGILLTSLYYMYKSYDFIVQVIETGQGY